jgi:hypothetical protein
VLQVVNDQLGWSVGCARPVDVRQRVGRGATVSVDRKLYPASVPVQGVGGQPGDVEGTMTASGNCSAAAVLNPVNRSIATTSMPSRHVPSWSARQVVNAASIGRRPRRAAWLVRCRLAPQ